MIQTFTKVDFKQMLWKNRNGITTQICIEPATASIEKNDFIYCLSSAPIEKDGEFSLFPGKSRLLTTVKGAGFTLNDDAYEKFEVANFSGDEKTYCSLLKGKVLDFGVIYDPQKIKAHAKIINLKSDLMFSLEEDQEYCVTVLDGALRHNGQILEELETLHYKKETTCNLQVVKYAVLFFLSLDQKSFL